ncbi:hypothetical protein G6F62_015334 [Rhizopus arrhizus]|nr:hypothetical protein G6F62_015334 [Rhizopus arrhizus]
MTWAAPASSRAWRLPGPRVTAMGVAPTALAISMAARPTLLLAAVMMTNSPAPSFACSSSAPQAVTYCIHTAAACSKPSDAGCLTTSRAGTLANSP